MSQYCGKNLHHEDKGTLRATQHNKIKPELCVIYGCQAAECGCVCVCGEQYMCVCDYEFADGNEDNCRFASLLLPC